LRWGDWSKTKDRPELSGPRGLPSVSSYRPKTFANPERLKVSNDRVDPSGDHGHRDLSKFRHDPLFGHGQSNKWSLEARQSLNINRMNYLGSGIFSVPRK
jgi:hypothetical protein